jgi:hypothetical protein
MAVSYDSSQPLISTILECHASGPSPEMTNTTKKILRSVRFLFGYLYTVDWYLDSWVVARGNFDLCQTGVEARGMPYLVT